MTKINYQETGFCKGFTQKSLTEANRKISEARKATPENIRHEFISRIRANKEGYDWFWVLK